MPLAIHVSFPQDFTTEFARRWNNFVGRYDVNIQADSVETMIAEIKKAVAARESPKHGHARIRSIAIDGHGEPGGWAIGFHVHDQYAALLTKERARWELLADLRPLWAKHNEGLTMYMCECAKGPVGRDFLIALSSQIGAKVKGWDLNYEIRATGKEFTATPDGTIQQTGDTGRTMQIVNHPWYLKYGITGPGRLLDLW